MSDTSTNSSIPTPAPIETTAPAATTAATPVAEPRNVLVSDPKTGIQSYVTESEATARAYVRLDPVEMKGITASGFDPGDNWRRQNPDMQPVWASKETIEQFQRDGWAPVRQNLDPTVLQAQGNGLHGRGTMILMEMPKDVYEAKQKKKIEANSQRIAERFRTNDADEQEAMRLRDYIAETQPMLARPAGGQAPPRSLTFGGFNGKAGQKAIPESPYLRDK